MSVIIKGMKMPESCDECRIMVFEDTNCVPELFCGCPIVFQAHPQGVGYRPGYCPLVPVPPHGRLIDADAVYKRLQKQAMSVWGDGNPRYQIVLDVMDAIRFAKTVIEAEEGE